MSAADNFVEGTYTIVKKPEYVDWCVKMGFPEEQVKKLSGTHWTMKFTKKSGSDYHMCFNCQELPAMDLSMDFSLNKELEMDHPLYGGKMTAVVTLEEDNVFKLEAEGDGLMGKKAWRERFSAEGMILELGGGDHEWKEMWARQ